MKEALYTTARLRPDIEKTWTPSGFEPGEVVAVKYWHHAYDATTRMYRPIFYIAKTNNFEQHFANGSFATVYNAALDSFVI